MIWRAISIDRKATTLYSYRGEVYSVLLLVTPTKRYIIIIVIVLRLDAAPVEQSHPVYNIYIRVVDISAGRICICTSIIPHGRSFCNHTWNCCGRYMVTPLPEAPSTGRPLHSSSCFTGVWLKVFRDRNHSPQ